MTYELDWLAAMRPFWHAVARSQDVTPDGEVATELLSHRFVLRRAAGGQVEVEAEDPATLEHRVVEAYGFVWVCLEQDGWERRSVPEIAALDAGTHRAHHGEPFTCSAQSLRYVEHVCELASATVITGAANDGTTIEAVSVDGGAWSLQFRAERIGVPAGATEAPAVDGYEVALPCSAVIEGARAGPAVFFHATPLGPYATRVQWATIVPVAGGATGTIVALERLLRTDLAALEARRPMGLSLDAASDVPLPQERFSVAYRRALASIGVPSAPSERRAPAGTGPSAHGEEVSSRA